MSEVMRECHAPYVLSFFFFNDTATTEIYTLSLHDALPILSARGSSSASRARREGRSRRLRRRRPRSRLPAQRGDGERDRKSTRLNSSHSQISYAVFCLKKKNERTQPHPTPQRDTLAPEIHC